MKWYLDFKRRWMSCQKLPLREREDTFTLLTQESHRQGRLLPRKHRIPVHILSELVDVLSLWATGRVHTGYDFQQLSRRLRD